MYEGEARNLPLNTAKGIEQAQELWSTVRWDEVKKQLQVVFFEKVQ
jgi:hypothetical protein